MARRTPDETRELILAAGLSLLMTRGLSAPVAHVRLQDAVRRAGLTTGAAYRLWPSQDDFHQDLAVRLIQHRARHPVAYLREIIATDSGLGFPEIVRRAAETHVRALYGEAQNDQFLLILAVRASSMSRDEVAKAGAARHEESVEEFQAVYEHLLQAYRWRMRTPFTVRDFTIAVAALAEGFAVQAVERLAHPTYAVVEGRSEVGLPRGEWTLMGVAVMALVNEMMMPA